MLIGIVGAPNKGKSTFFSASTMVDAEIADYPFTTIKPNKGAAYVARECVEKEFGLKCNPKNSLCINGTRLIPINVIDVAGLVPDASSGKGMGNQFLSDLAGADAFIQIVDASGKTDVRGNKCDDCDPAEDVLMLKEEMSIWLADILEKHIRNLSKREDGAKAIAEVLTGFRFTEEMIKEAIDKCALTSYNIKWKKEDILRFAQQIIDIGKPMIVAANKSDATDTSKIQRLKERLKDYKVIPCSAAIELALRKASKAGDISYVPGSRSFEINKEVIKEKESALKYMKSFISKNGTGVQDVFNTLIFEVLNVQVVYPVEDENKFCDHFGNVLPDAVLIKKGAKLPQLAEKIHTDLAKHLLYGVDAKKKMRIGKDYEIKDNDIIKIVSSAK